MRLVSISASEGLPCVTSGGNVYVSVCWGGAIVAGGASDIRTGEVERADMAIGSKENPSVCVCVCVCVCVSI